MPGAVEVLIVCTANQLRSPMAELLLRRALLRDGDPAHSWHVRSAGLHAADGHPIHPLAREVLLARGAIDETAIDEFRSRQLAPAMVRSADLVLTAEHVHRERVVALVPDARRRTMTLRQCARLVQADGARRRRPRLATRITRRARTRWTTLGDDLHDPIGRSRRHVRRTAREIEVLVDTIAAGRDTLSLTARAREG